MKAPPKRITAGDVGAAIVPTSSAEVQGAQLVTVDARRVLPCVPELYRVPVDFVHDHPHVLRAGGLPLIVETVAEMLPGVRFDRPETIPPPARAVMRAIHKRSPFGLVIIAGSKAWWVDIRADLPRLPHG